MNNLNTSPKFFKVPTEISWATLPLLVDASGGRWLALGLISHSLGISLGRFTIPKTEDHSWARRCLGGYECLPIDRCPKFFASIREGSVPALARPLLFWARQHAFRAMSNFTIPAPVVPMLEVEPEHAEVAYIPQTQAVVDLVTLNGTEPVTTSLAIAQGTDNDHASVIKLVRTYQQDLEEFGILDLKSENQTGNAGRPTEFAILNEQQATLLMTYMRNSDIVRKFKMRLVKAFYALSHQQVVNQNPANLSRLQILTMAIEAEQKVQELSCTVQERDATIEAQHGTISTLEPKADALDRLSGSNGTTCITGAAKALKVNPGVLTDYMEQHKWIYRRQGPRGHGETMAFQARINDGSLSHRIVPIVHRDGSLTSKNQILVTAKGLTKLAQGLGIAS